MKTLNAKRIAAVAAGAALLGIGLAFAGAITFQNVPIVTAAGQPVIQIVVGSTAQPSDGVAAANIAAAIGNLAYTSQPVTASVNATQAASVLKVTLGKGASYSLSGQEVWLNETGATSVSGSYPFSAYIGSVLNGGINLNLPSTTKALQPTSSAGYSFPHDSTGFSYVVSPVPSPYSGTGIPTQSVSSSTNGGGVSFSKFGASGATVGDNIFEITPSDLGGSGGLLNGFGSYGETEYLWVAGFPVYDQATGYNQFALVSATGAYQVVFNNPIERFTNNGANNYNQAQIRLLGQNWTILNSSTSSVTGAGQQKVGIGGSMYLASSLSPLTTVYVGHNLTSGAFTVQLEDLGQPANGISPAAINVYFNGVLTNTSSITPGTGAQPFNVTGHKLYVKVNQTFAGLYAYQKWAKMQLYSNVYQVVSGSEFNSTYDKGWNVQLWWTNTTASSGNADALYSIILYNSSAQTLEEGQSLNFIEQPAAWKLTFVGETQSSGNFDPVTFTTGYQGAGTYYQNNGGSTTNTPTITNITEPMQTLTVKGANNDFQVGGQYQSSVTYDLDPFTLGQDSNALSTQGNYGSNLTIIYTGPDVVHWINGTNGAVTGSGLVQSVYGGVFESAGSSSVTNTTDNPSNQTSYTASAGVLTIKVPLGSPVDYVKAITLSAALPTVSTDTLNVIVQTGSAAGQITLASLQSASAAALYKTSSANYNYLTSSAVQYTTSGVPEPFTLAAATAPTPSNAVTGQNAWFTYTVNELTVGNTNSTATDELAFDIKNTTTGISAGAGTVFALNYSTLGSGQSNNLTYRPSGFVSDGSPFNVKPGFRTERGSQVTSVGSGSVTVSFAKTVDQLQFAVGPLNATAVTHNYRSYGPYSVGQTTNIANVTIGAVAANVTVTGGNGTSVTGIGQIQAVPSVSQADVPVLLKNLSSTAPLALLDTAASASPSSPYILVGSGFVNSLSAQLQSQYGVTFTPTSAPVLQAYGTNRILVAGYTAAQTTAEADAFIQQLYAQASV